MYGVHYMWPGGKLRTAPGKIYILLGWVDDDNFVYGGFNDGKIEIIKVVAGVSTTYAQTNAGHANTRSAMQKSGWVTAHLSKESGGSIWNVGIAHPFSELHGNNDADANTILDTATHVGLIFDGRETGCEEWVYYQPE